MQGHQVSPVTRNDCVQRFNTRINPILDTCGDVAPSVTDVLCMAQHAGWVDGHPSAYPVGCANLQEQGDRMARVQVECMVEADMYQIVTQLQPRIVPLTRAMTNTFLLNLWYFIVNARASQLRLPTRCIHGDTAVFGSNSVEWSGGVPLHKQCRRVN